MSEQADRLASIGAAADELGYLVTSVDDDRIELTSGSGTVSITVEYLYHRMGDANQLRGDHLRRYLRSLKDAAL